MSKYIPATAVRSEQIAQALRLTLGLKDGTYVRVRVGKKLGTTLKHKAEREGWTILSETEFREALQPPKKEEVAPVTDTGTSEAKNEN